LATSLLLAAVSVLAVGEFLLFGALAEAYRDIRQLRDASGVVDSPTPVELGHVMGSKPSDCGLDPALDAAVGAVTVFLERRCSTCDMILRSLNGHIPAGMWLALVTDSADDAVAWLRGSGMAVEKDDLVRERIMIFSPAQVQRNIGDIMTPLAMEIEHGRLLRAKTVPSVRQFYALIPTILSISKTLEQGASR
jgi:hypothetical protein